MFTYQSRLQQRLYYYMRARWFESRAMIAFLLGASSSIAGVFTGMMWFLLGTGVCLSVGWSLMYLSHQQRKQARKLQ